MADATKAKEALKALARAEPEPEKEERRASVSELTKHIEHTYGAARGARAGSASAGPSPAPLAAAHPRSPHRAEARSSGEDSGNMLLLLVFLVSAGIVWRFLQLP